MAKTTAPLLSFGAGGAIGKTQVYASWKGIPYARKYVVPANPRSTDQTLTRSVFTILCALWKNLGADATAPFMAFATGKPLTDRNAYLKFNVKALRSGSDWTALVGSPGAAGGVPLASFSASGGSGTISTTVTAPTPPTGWTLTKVTAVARVNDDPHTSTNDTAAVASATTSPWQPSFSGLAAGSYIVTCWPVWDTGGGKLAYGASLNHTATVT
ncbi:MAG TPA: hypothetical protein VLW83_18930 [Candidatus Acidoferrales bacterium]|nr:hypothetical protein [Candidatus Acidoferrales bacterium]